MKAIHVGHHVEPGQKKYAKHRIAEQWLEATGASLQIGEDTMKETQHESPELRPKGTRASAGRSRDRRDMTRILAFLFLVAVCALPSCRTMPDTNDPQCVAEAYLQALVGNDYETALSHVWEEDREQFRAHLCRWGLPPGFPRTGKVETFIKRTGNGRMAGANFLDGEEEKYGVDMRFINGRWWITEQ